MNSDMHISKKGFGKEILMEKVILATQNAGKISEMREIFSKFGMDVISRDDMGLPKDEIEETGSTFEENSYIKASTIAKQCDGIVVADDSGIAVDCIGGKPGVYSARFAGEGCTPRDNNVKLLQLLDGIPTEERGARFVSVITLIYPDGKTLVARGECEGTIAEKMRGENGFGYDPIFIPEGYDQTFGELPAELKNRISHRAKSLLKLEELISEQRDR